MPTHILSHEEYLAATQGVAHASMLSVNEVADAIQYAYDRSIPRDILVYFIVNLDNAHRLLHDAPMVYDLIDYDGDLHPVIAALSDQRKNEAPTDLPATFLAFMDEHADLAMSRAQESAEGWIEKRIAAREAREAAEAEEATRPRPFLGWYGDRIREEEAQR